MIEHETKEYWREKVGISFGMSKEEALEKFRDRKETKRTCLRCELPLPSCPDWNSKDAYESSYVLSGDIYMWKAAQPGH